MNNSNNEQYAIEALQQAQDVAGGPRADKLEAAAVYVVASYFEELQEMGYTLEQAKGFLEQDIIRKAVIRAR